MDRLSAIKQQLLDRYPYKFELHAHSYPASGCSEFSPAELVERCKNAGAHGLVLTNHAVWWMQSTPKEEWCAQYQKDYHDARIAGDRLGVTVLLGFELRFPENENDYLVYGFEEVDIPRIYDWLGTSAQTFYEGFCSEDHLIIQAHPNRRDLTEMGRNCVDGYEVFNLHPGHNSRIAFTARLHQRNGGVITGGTDLHHPGHEGSLLTCFAEMPDNEKDLVRLLRSGDYVFMTADKVILP